MNSLICGSGFGLYGYLPAIYPFSSKIYLNKKYKTFFNSRRELAKFKSKVVWYDNVNKITHKINYLIIAKRPKDQLKIIKFFLKKKKKIKHYFLEKPISTNPKKASELLDFFYKKKVNYSVGFLFKYTIWFKLIKNELPRIKKSKILIKWNIPEKNKSSKLWKYSLNEGGGLIRYYGIHFIKLFSDFNFDKIKKNIIKKNSWEITIHDRRDNVIKLILKYSTKANFSYKINETKVNKIDTPFSNKIDYKSIDPRCFFLKKYIRQNLSTKRVDDMKKFLNLWDIIEKKIS